MTSTAPVLVPDDVHYHTFHTLQKASRAAREEQHAWLLIYLLLAMFLLAWTAMQVSLRVRPREMGARRPVNWALIAQQPESLVPYEKPSLSLQAMEDPTTAYLETHPEVARTVAFQEWERSINRYKS